MGDTVKWLNWVFQVLQYQGNWNKVGGVYIFAGLMEVHLGNFRWNAYYIGQTHDFSQRIPNHEKWKLAEKYGATHVHALSEENEITRIEIEGQLIRSYQPPLNSGS